MSLSDLVLLPVQRPCAQCFENAESGVRKGLCIERVYALELPQIHLKKARVQASFMPREGKMGGAVYKKSPAPRGIPGEISMFKAGGISPKAMGTMQSWTRWSQRA